MILHPIKSYWQPCEEDYYVIIPMNIRNSDGVFDQCDFTPTTEEDQ